MTVSPSPKKFVSAPLALSFRNNIEQRSVGSLEIAFGPNVDRLLAGAVRVAQVYGRSFDWLLSSFDLSSIPDAYVDRVRLSARELPYFGLYTNCLMYDYPNRLNFALIDPDRIHSLWCPRTLTANSFMKACDDANRRWPSAIFSILYQPLEDLQQSLGLGWWRRTISNKNKFQNLFASGLLLGVCHDSATQGRPFPF
jgi:hypothetical protein